MTSCPRTSRTGHDPDSPATEAQRRKLISVGCDPNAANDARLSKGTASAWIDDFKRAAERKAVEAGGFTPADQLPPASTAPPGQPAVTHPATAPQGPPPSSPIPTTRTGPR